MSNKRKYYIVHVKDIAGKHPAGPFPRALALFLQLQSQVVVSDKHLEKMRNRKM